LPARARLWARTTDTCTCGSSAGVNTDTCTCGPRAGVDTDGRECVNKDIVKKIEINPGKGLPCAVAHYIAAELGVAPLEVGQTANDLDVRGTMCQLGLFGYAEKGRPAARPRRPMENVPAALEEAIRAAIVDGTVSCAALWRIADELDFSRLEMGNAVEALGIKVTPCQLGFF
jgi:hypothetical protein